MTDRKFFLPADHLRRDVAPGRGGCLATDQITVDGLGVGYMYREATERDLDSGWRFYSGRESQEYVDDLRNTTVYDVNTIANYAPDIVPFLDAPCGSAFARGEDGRWHPDESPTDAGG